MNDAPLVDLSHVIESGRVTYKGLPAPIICDYLSREASRSKYAPGTEFHIGRIDMIANTGTYLDAPFHRYADGDDLAALPLDRLANLPCIIARIGTEVRSIERLPFSARDVRGKAVLIQTNWDQHWRTDQYFEGHPYLTGELAQWLVDAGVMLVGIDSFNIDSVDTGERPVHSILLRHNIPIAEHMTNLAAAPEQGGHFFAVPPKVKNFGTFPVRAFISCE